MAEIFRSPIAEPYADKSMSKSIIKLASSCNPYLVSEAGLAKRGVKEVVKQLRKKKRGIVILAGDISPIELVAHIPILCENNGNPYIYVKTKEDLAEGSLSKKPTTILLLMRPSSSHELKDLYKDLYEKILEANPYMEASAS